MKNCLLIFAAVASLACGQAHAAVITGLFNTGTDGNNVALVGGDGLSDPHYSILSSTSPGFAGNQAVTYFNSAYAPQDANSRWISISANGNPGNNTTVYRTTFSLSGFDASSAQITGLWAVDNNAFISLNGTHTGIALGNGGGSFGALHAFTISSGFVTGLNTLDFHVTDVGPPTALRVANIAGAADLAPVTGGVPEPATWAVMILGFGGTGAMLRRRRLRYARTW